MATMAEMEYILGKAIIDTDFRAMLMKDPDAAAKSIGLSLTPAQSIGIKKIDAAKFEKWAKMFMDVEDDPGYLW